MRSAMLAVGLLIAKPADAQMDPVATAEDPGVQELAYSVNQPMQLKVARGGDLTVALADGEVPQSISSSAPASWRITLDTVPGRFIVHPLPGATDSSLSVLTRQHAYNFVISLVPPTRSPYLIRLTYREASATTDKVTAIAPDVPKPARYKITGTRELRPIGISDDGGKTYIEWSRDQAIPAVFAVDGLRREEMVNGYMRDDIFTIDRVYERLVFRIDRAMAMATRQAKRKGR